MTNPSAISQFFASFLVAWEHNVVSDVAYVSRKKAAMEHSRS
jgi:hypothetical protein